MSQEIQNTERLNMSDILNEVIISSADSKTFTPRSKSEQIKQTKKTATKRVMPTAKYFTTEKNNKSAPRRRSLTMTDIRNKIPDPVRTPIKYNMKPDSCSTTDYSPRLSNEHPAEVMLTIRRRELQIRTFAKIFYSLWRKQKFLAENACDEANQLQVQISFLKNLREKECASRDSMTNLADQLKTEIIDLNGQITQLTKDRDTMQYFNLNLQQEYSEIFQYIQNYSADLDTVNGENQQVLVKVKELGDVMDARFIGLKRSLRWVEEINNRAQQHIATYNDMQRTQIETFKTIEKLEKTNKLLQEKLKTKEENENNLKETIKELRKSLENSTAKSSDLKSEVKNIKLQLEFTELQLKKKEFRPYPWSIIARKAARLSMYILFQVGFFQAF